MRNEFGRFYAGLFVNRRERDDSRKKGERVNLSSSRGFVVVLTAAVFLCSCGANTAALPRAGDSQPSSSNDARVAQALSAMGIKIPATAQTYRTDTLSVRDGDSISLFPSASIVVHSGDRIIVTDAQSKATTSFPSSAKVEIVVGGGRVFVTPHNAVPDWAVKSNARLMAAN